MIVPTHRLIANEMISTIYYNTDIKLDSQYFLFGNVLPDIAPKYIQIKHFINNSFEFILNKIDVLIDAESLNLKKFSTDLGIITHYICDYFCYPHFDRDYYYKKVTEHMIYERALHSKFKILKYKPNVTILSGDNDVRSTIRKYIYDLQEEYSKTHKSIENDIAFALDAAISVAIFIIYKSKFYYESLIKLKLDL